MLSIAFLYLFFKFATTSWKRCAFDYRHELVQPDIEHFISLLNYTLLVHNIIKLILRYLH